MREKNVEETISLLRSSPYRLSFIDFLKKYDTKSISIDFGFAIKPAVESLGAELKNLIKKFEYSKLTGPLEFEGMPLDSLVTVDPMIGKIYDLDKDGRIIRHMRAPTAYSDDVVMYPKPK